MSNIYEVSKISLTERDIFRDISCLVCTLYRQFAGYKSHAQ